MKILEPLAKRGAQTPQTTEQRYYGIDELLMSFQGNNYLINPMAGSRPDIPDASFQGYIDGIYRRNGVVAAAVVTRALLMSQLRFVWRYDRLAGDRAGETFVNRALRPLERPGSTTRSNLLFAAEVDASFSGSAYFVRSGSTIRRLTPDHCSVVLASDSDPSWDGDTLVVPHDAEVQALLYHPRRGGRGLEGAEVFMPGEFAIWSPEPDPVHFWRGSSWVTSVLREVVADDQATDHQQKYFERAATPNAVLIMDPSKTPSEVAEYAEVFNAKFSGAQNAYRNWFLGGGTDVKTIGSTLSDLNLKDLTGGFENRIAIRSRIPAVILGAREGLSGSSLNQGNYASARRLLADGWFAPTAESLCQALEAIVPPPRNAELWYDRSEVLFLQEDQKDAADIAATQAAAIRQLIDGGYEPSSVAVAVSTGDMLKLKHTGNLSVQLQPPGSTDEPASDDPDDDPDDESGRSVRSAGYPMEQLRLELHNHTHVTRSDVTVEPPVVHVEPADVHVVNHVPEQRAETPVVQVNVDPTPVTIENRVEVDPTPVTVENQVNVDTPPAQVTVVGDDKPARFKVRRNDKGQITEVNEEG